MSKIPPVTAEELIKFLQKRGFEIGRQKGSHVILKNNNTTPKLITVVALHGKGKPIPMTTLMAILRQTNIDRDDLIENI